MFCEELENGAFLVECAGYSLRAGREGFSLLLGGESVFDFEARSAVCATDADDIDVGPLAFERLTPAGGAGTGGAIAGAARTGAGAEDETVVGEVPGAAAGAGTVAVAEDGSEAGGAIAGVAAARAGAKAGAWAATRAGGGGDTGAGEAAVAGSGAGAEAAAGTAVVFRWTARSSLWERKTYALACGARSCAYSVEVFGARTLGEARLGEIRYFSGARGGAGAGSFYDASRYFFPVATGGFDDNRYYASFRPSRIGLDYMTPPPLCYPFQMEGAPGWLGVGLFARDGAYNFDHFAYRLGERGGCYFSTDLAGSQAVGSQAAASDAAAAQAADPYGVGPQAAVAFEAPGIVFIGGGDEFAVLRNYADFMFSSGLCRRWRGERPAWHRGPIFCGWGEQCLLGGEKPDGLATQAEYGRMSARLDDLGISPSIIIIDAKWQAAYGEALPDPQKWPSLRAFADGQHEKGRRVLLWFKAWDTEGLPTDECATLWMQPVGADPTNPKYQKRVRDTFRALLSADRGCCNCDGFKIDFANCMPLGKDIAVCEKGVYGIELLKRMLSLLYSAAKAAKPDALVSNSACHPYFAEVADQARLHDYASAGRGAEAHLRQRAGIYGASMPDAIIDTDGAGWASRRDAMRYMRVAAGLGVPDLYFLSAPFLKDEDFAEIKEIFDGYRKRLGL